MTHTHWMFQPTTQRGETMTKTLCVMFHLEKNEWMDGCLACFFFVVWCCWKNFFLIPKYLMQQEGELFHFCFGLIQFDWWWWWDWLLTLILILNVEKIFSTLQVKRKKNNNNQMEKKTKGYMIEIQVWLIKFQPKKSNKTNEMVMRIWKHWMNEWMNEWTKKESFLLDKAFSRKKWKRISSFR